MSFTIFSEDIAPKLHEPEYARLTRELQNQTQCFEHQKILATAIDQEIELFQAEYHEMTLRKRKALQPSNIHKQIASIEKQLHITRSLLGEAEIGNFKLRKQIDDVRLKVLQSKQSVSNLQTEIKTLSESSMQTTALHKSESEVGLSQISKINSIRAASSQGRRRIRKNQCSTSMNTLKPQAKKSMSFKRMNFSIKEKFISPFNKPSLLISNKMLTLVLIEWQKKVQTKRKQLTKYMNEVSSLIKTYQKCKKGFSGYSIQQLVDQICISTKQKINIQEYLFELSKSIQSLKQEIQQRQTSFAQKTMRSTQRFSMSESLQMGLKRKVSKKIIQIKQMQMFKILVRKKIKKLTPYIDKMALIGRKTNQGVPKVGSEIDQEDILIDLYKIEMIVDEIFRLKAYKNKKSLAIGLVPLKNMHSKSFDANGGLKTFDVNIEEINIAPTKWINSVQQMKEKAVELYQELKEANNRSISKQQRATLFNLTAGKFRSIKKLTEMFI